VACEFEAISERPETIGTIRNYRIGNNEILSEGRLKIGSAMQTLLIKQVKQKVREDMDVVIFDAPPGTSCPVVETIAEADYVILVTEPTPFGLYDLRLTVEILRDMGKPFGAIINKAGIGNHKVHEFLSDQKIDILSEIPYDREYASKYASGELLSNHSIEIEIKYKAIIRKLMASYLRNEGNYDLKW
jgi:MinD superfamily P-loop ATPase